MNVYESTAMQMFGNNSRSCLTSCRLRPSLRTQFSVCMVVCRPASTLSTRLDSLTAFRKLHMKAQSAIYYGQIPTSGVAGVSLLEVPATASDKTFQNSSTIRITWHELLVRISWSWTATTGHMNVTSSQFSQRPITAIVVETRPPLWRSTSSWNIISSSLTLLLAKLRYRTSASGHLITSFERIST